MIESDPIRERFMSLSPHLSERERRLFAATEARAAGYGGIAAVSAATGIAVSTIGRGLKELSALDTLAPDRVRRPGGGSVRPHAIDDSRSERQLWWSCGSQNVERNAGVAEKAAAAT